MFRRDLKRGKPRKGAPAGAGSSDVSETPSERGGGREGRKGREGQKTFEGRQGREKRGGRSGESGDRHAFVLYVEGPRDREILGHWAKRVDPALARCIATATVILGGKQPARAISDFRKRGARVSGASGLIVLDRDHHNVADHEVLRQNASEAGLEIFVWSLRHIESYLLVPDVIRRVLGMDLEDRRIEALIERHHVTDGPDGETGQGTSLHAKRILGVGGALSEELGREARAGEIARAMRPEDLHDDVYALFDRVRELSGLGQQQRPEVEVIVRASSPTAGS